MANMANSKAYNFNLAIFDMAGTTIRDKGEVPNAFLAALNEFDLTVSADQLTSVRGASKREALKLLLGADKGELLDAIYSRFVEVLAGIYEDVGVSPVSGAEETFSYLRKAGVLLALNTGFDRTIVDLLLEKLEWPQSMFAAIVCGEDVARGRPAPDLIFAVMNSAGADNAREVMNIGDTVLDMKAGANAGVGLNVGVLSGAHTREQLVAAPHTHLIESVADLPILAESLRSGNASFR